MSGEQDRPTDGSFYAVGGTLRKAPFHQKKDGTTTISMGFAVAELSEWVDEDFAGEIAACLNAHDELVAALRLALPWVSPPLDDHDMSASGVAHRAIVAALAKATP